MSNLSAQEDATEVDKAELERFILDNPELQELEKLLDEFNIFEAIGAVRQELRHSDFLAFLLNPSENHGLSDAFLKRTLMQVLSDADNAPFSPIEIDINDLSGAIVHREWRHIDILIEDEKSEIIVAVENKIYSEEHSDQLSRYRQVVYDRYPSYRHVFIFLTPDELPPTDDQYIPLSYGQVAEILDGVFNSHQSTLGADIFTLGRQYTAMLRRHIVSDSEIGNLSRQIYQRHKRALDLIFEYRPDLQQEIADYLLELIRDTDGIVEDHCNKTYIRFVPEYWDQFAPLRRGKGWTRSGRILLLEFNNTPERLSLIINIGPGPELVRKTILEITSTYKPFKSSTTLNQKWNGIFSQRILNRRDLDDVTLEDLQPKIERFWRVFLEEDLPSIRAIIEDEIPWDELEQQLEAGED